VSELLAQAVPLAISIHDVTKWLSPDFLLKEFGTALFWVGILVLFVECGLLFPFLPGDTLLFAMGLFIAEDKVDIIPGGHLGDLLLCLVIYSAAAFAGNVTGYEIGAQIGPRIYEREGRIVKRVYLERTSEFFDRHGHSALVAGRFVPFVRTYITLVAGVTLMKRHVFFVWSAIGAAAWVVSLTVVGYVLGQTFPSLGKYIDLVTYGLLMVTVVALAYEIWHKRHEDQVRRDKAAADAATESD
jgi:membrane-associated protein